MIISQSNSMEIAKTIFERTKYEPSHEDIKRLSNNIILLEERGLGKLCQRLIQGGRGIWDTFSELNFAMELVLLPGTENRITYEPNEGLQRPVDFKVEMEDKTFWIQVKKLSDLARENRQNKLIQEIKRQSENIRIGKFFSLELSPEVSETDIPDLIQFISVNAKNSKENHDYFFPDSIDRKVKVSFWLPNKVKLSYLTLGISGDTNVVEITGLAEGQIKESLVKASGAFDWKVEQETINLIAMDADKQEDIDICNALFGTEFDTFKGNRQVWCRKNDGLFINQEFSDKIAGVIGLRRKEWKPLCSYHKLLFVNEVFLYHLDNIKRIIRIDKVIHSKMRPQDTNFKLS